jgi:uncharacterized protein with PQ loop repeat
MDNMLLLKSACLATGFALHMAPIPTMREIRAARSTLNFHVAPYASTLLNHSVNLWYAIVIADTPLRVHRVIGIIAQLTYLSTYVRFAPPIKAPLVRQWVLLPVVVLTALFVWLHILLPLAGRTDLYRPHIAFAGAVTGIGLAASPLATVGEVLRTKDASSLPMHLCAMVFIQCSAWTIYGALRGDLSTFANNAVGVILGAVQLGLIYTYPSKRGARAYHHEKGEEEVGLAAAAPAPTLGSSSGAGNTDGGLVIVSPHGVAEDVADLAVGGGSGLAGAGSGSGSTSDSYRRVSGGTA